MKKFRNICLSVALVSCTALAGCGGDAVPSDVMDRETMTSFLKEAYTLEGFYAIESAFHYDTLQPQMLDSYDSLLAAYNITRQDFEHSVEWYAHHPELYGQMHQEVINQLDSMMTTP